ncbi:MAG TPA: PAS domain S-box protein [Chloroflexota bacterium]|nr:PAS domain S-box protein [Chloroflexota bacterium]
MGIMRIDEAQGDRASATPVTDGKHLSGVQHLDSSLLDSFTQAPALIALLAGPDHVYQFVNERYVQLLGDRHFIGRSVRDAVPELAEQGIVEILDRVYTTGEPFHATEMALGLVRGLTGVREEGYYNFVYHPLRDSSAAVTGIMLHAVEVTEQVRARRQSEQLAAERAATLSQMADGVIIIDTTGRITFQNEAARRLLGVDGLGLSLEAWLDTIQLLTMDGAPVPFEETWLARTVRGGEPSLGVERLIRRSDGTELAVHGSATPVLAEDGSLYGSVFTFRDITDRKRLEEELRRRARQQEAVARLGHDALARLDQSGLLTESMSVVAQLLDVDRCRFLEYLSHDDAFVVRAGVGWPADVIGRPQGLTGTASQARYTSSSREPVLVEDLRRETRFRPPLALLDLGVISTMSVVVQGGEQIFGVLEVDSSTPRAFTQDDVHFLRTVANVLAAAIERHRLDESRFALAALVESSSDAIIGATLDGVITTWDRGAEQLYGYPASAALGQSISLIVPPDRADETASVLAIVRTGRAAEHIETVWRHRDGHLNDISVSVSPIRDASGAVTGALSIAHDIGKRKRLERERTLHQRELTSRALQAQEDERKRIARDLHDQTVQALTTLLINLDLAERRLPEGGGDAASALARVRSIAKRALDETRTLAHSLRPPILDDIGLVAALEALGEEYTQTYGVRVVVESEGGVESDTRLPAPIETVLFRVAQEALTNACKHARGSEVRIGFTLDGGYRTLTVSDNGQGFDAQQLAVSGHHGGLGLDGMRERAALVGAKLHIDSAPEKGTRVTLRVPVGDIERRCQADDPETGHRSAETSSTLNVLLVDDHAMVREGLKMILETQLGIRITGEAEDGRQALDLVERLRPDVVVMDIAMPDLNGFDATRQIKRRFPEVKVLILTSHENRQYVTQIAKTGADGCLLKRSAGTELVTALETLQAGRRYVSPSVAGTLLDDYRVRIDQGGEDLLTEREREVVQLVAEGHTNQGIARKLGISIKTVETHRTNIMEKLGATDRTDLVKYAIRTGMISPE